MFFILVSLYFLQYDTVYFQEQTIDFPDGEQSFLAYNEDGEKTSVSITLTICENKTVGIFEAVLGGDDST